VTRPKSPRVPVSAPRVGEKEVRLVARAIREGWVSSRGPFVDAFERRFSRWIGTSSGISTSSGTTALHLALAALEIGPGDEVILPDFTMVACANAVLYSGARPVFVDVDPQTWTIAPELVARKINARTRAIMPVHLYGHPAEMDSLIRIARTASLPLVEDAAEAHGATYRGKKVGGLGALGCFSFYSNKVITTGEGGMVVTNSRRLADRARSLRDLAYAHELRDYHHQELAFNYRLTNLQAALGLAQLSQAAKFIRHRRECTRIYSDLLSSSEGLQLPMQAPWARSVYWMYTVRVRGGGARRLRLMKALAHRGIETRVGFWPMHRQPFLSRFVSPSDRFPVSDALGRESLSLPSGNGISAAEVERVAMAVRAALRE
jgi:perosamine synthetase